MWGRVLYPYLPKPEEPRIPGRARKPGGLPPCPQERKKGRALRSEEAALEKGLDVVDIAPTECQPPQQAESVGACPPAPRKRDRKGERARDREGERGRERERERENERERERERARVKR